MAIVKACTSFYPGVALSTDTGGIGQRNGATLDTEGDLECYVFDVDEADGGRTIDALHFGMSNPSVAGNLEAQLCNIGTDGRPDTASPIATGTFTVSGSDWYRVAMTPNYQVTGNELLGLNIIKPSGSSYVGATGWMRRQMWKTFIRFPYVIRFTGSWSRLSVQTPANDCPTIVPHCTDGGFLHTQGTVPFQDRVLRSTGLGGEWGVKFSLPWECAVGQTCMSVSYVADAVDDFNIGNSSYLPGHTGANRLSTVEFLHQQAEFFSNRTHLQRFPSVVVQPGEDYYLTIRPKTGATARGHTRNVNRSGNRDDRLEEAIGFPRGFNFVAVEDDGAGGWTEFPDEVPQISIGVLGWNDTAGGGGTPVAHAARSYTNIPGARLT